jgi:hypothetical protein
VDADFSVLIDQTLSAAAQVKIFADAAIEIEHEIQASNESILGRAIKVTTSVDGAVGASEYSARITSLITYDFGGGSLTDVLQFIGQELEKNSPVGPSGDRHAGQYRTSHVLFADGIMVSLDRIPEAREYLFASTLPYSRRIEDGESHQAPSGVYEYTANNASQRFTDVTIEFVDYGGEFGAVEQPQATQGKRRSRTSHAVNTRYPAIRVTVK